MRNCSFQPEHIWSRVGLILNLVTALLAGVAGVSTLAELAGARLAGIGALFAAGLAALSSALGADRRSADAAKVGNGYIELRDALRQLADLDLATVPVPQLRPRSGASRHGSTG